jgi:putative intracellular protease/amidase
MHTEILLYDGFDELDAFGPYEPLAGAGIDTRLVSLAGDAEVVGSQAHGSCRTRR